MNINKINNNNKNIQRSYFDLYKKGILDAFYERGILHMQIKDYLNFASTCWDNREALISEFYEKNLKKSFLFQSVFHRLITTSKEIDRTDRPKYEAIPEPIGIGMFGGHIGGIDGVLISQNTYEVNKLRTACEGFSFQTISDEDRNNFLDLLNEYDSEEIEQASIGSLMEHYGVIKKQHPELESILESIMIFVNQKKDESAVQDIKEYLFILLLLIVFVVFISFCI